VPVNSSFKTGGKRKKTNCVFVFPPPSPPSRPLFFQEDKKRKSSPPLLAVHCPTVVRSGTQLVRAPVATFEINSATTGPKDSQKKERKGFTFDSSKVLGSQQKKSFTVCLCVSLLTIVLLFYYWRRCVIIRAGERERELGVGDKTHKRKTKNKIRPPLCI